MLEQAIGLMMYDPGALRRARPGARRSSTCPRCCPSARRAGPEQRKLEVSEMILAVAARLHHRLAGSAGTLTGVEAGFEALARALGRKAAAE